MPGYQKNYVGLNTNVDAVFEELKIFFSEHGYKIKSLNKKKGIMEVQIDKAFDKSYGKISFIGDPSNYDARVDWDASLRKVFWINFITKLQDLIKANSTPEKQEDVGGLSWSPSEEVVGKLDWRRMPDDPELVKMRKETETELDGKRSVFLAQANVHEHEGQIKEALRLYQMAVIISKDLGENVYAEMFESKIGELEEKAKK
ncbi:MAG: hypothetical protein ACUVXA_14060 [Candidatus Jordarchaeum sp.]|uniref:hypothetical protein n=1 Tax=Candidatus Jordarchaeum sp. TaxID=2823881 RepID=UPI00404A907C